MSTNKEPFSQRALHDALTLLICGRTQKSERNEEDTLARVSSSGRSFVCRERPQIDGFILRLFALTWVLLTNALCRRGKSKELRIPESRSVVLLQEFANECHGLYYQYEKVPDVKVESLYLSSRSFQITSTLISKSCLTTTTSPIKDSTTCIKTLSQLSKKYHRMSWQIGEQTRQSKTSLSIRPELSSDLQDNKAMIKRTKATKLLRRRLKKLAPNVAVDLH